MTPACMTFGPSNVLTLYSNLVAIDDFIHTSENFWKSHHLASVFNSRIGSLAPDCKPAPILAANIPVCATAVGAKIKPVVEAIEVDL